MKKIAKFNGLMAGAAPVVLGFALLSAPAYAQDEAPQEIIVTGSLITNPNLVSSSPVAFVGENEMSLRQTQTAEQILRELPGAVPSIGSSVNNGNAGASYVNLRNLGNNRNIVLLDGNRLVPAGASGGVDLNNIPLALVERVDVLTGGASTTYGADAVSGVVNFITKRDFSGLDFSVSNQITGKGDSNYLRADLTLGANFDDGRGNAVFSVGYQEADALYFDARNFGRDQISSGDGAAAGGSPTSTPTSIGFTDGDFLQIAPDGGSLVDHYQDFNFAPYNVYVTPFKRFNFFGQANYEVSDSVEVYARGLFSRNTVSTIIAPSGIFGEALTVPSNNPYLTPGIRQQLCEKAGLVAECASGAVVDLALPEVYRRTAEIGPRVSEYVTTVFDIRTGVRLNVSETTSLDLSAGYGESDNVQTQSGYVLRSRVQQALDADNVTTCVNPANGCVPLNLFGPPGSITADQAAFLQGQSMITVKTKLSQARALYSGDFGIASPGAVDPIGFAVGGEYRRYSFSQIPDAYAAIPGELGGAGGAVPPFDGGYDVYEAFGEVIAPLVQDQPFFKSLTLEAGIRYSKYSVDAASSPEFDATTYKAGLTWEPTGGVKLRGNYQRAVRAPNILELFDPVTTRLDNLETDPCSGAAPTLDPNLAAVCIAQGAPADAVNAGTVLPPASGQTNVTGGGNINIRPEKATTFTAGILLQPRAVPGLTVTVDYYNIKVDNAITSATPDDILSACFDNITAASATDPACTSIRRSATGRLSGSSASVPGLPQPLTNLGLLKTDGIDLVVDYTHDVGFAKLNFNFNGNWANSRTFRASPTSITRECVGYYSVNCASIQPEFYWNQRTTLSFDDVDVSLLWRHIDGVRYEPGLPPLFSGTITGGALDGQQANFNRIPSYDYFDLTGRFNATENLTLTLTVTNLFDKKPPIVGSTAGSTSFNSGNTFPSTYDAIGRRFTAGARFRF